MIYACFFESEYFDQFDDSEDISTLQEPKKKGLEAVKTEEENNKGTDVA